MLQLDNVLVHHQDAFTFLRTATRTFDIVFLDPPFEAYVLPELLELIVTHEILSDQGVVYIEQGIRDTDTTQYVGWKTLKHGRAGEVDFRLVSRQDKPQT